MEKKKMEETLEIPEGVTVSVDKGIFTVNGPKGEVRRDLAHLCIAAKVESNTIVLSTVAKATKREKTKLGTIKSHVKNMMKGVTNGHLYKLKICSGHFPMNVSISGNEVVVKNFIGEKIPRKSKIRENVSVKMDDKIIEVESCDKEAAGQMAADIETKTKRCGFDKRIFQDGIFIIMKDGKEL